MREIKFRGWNKETGLMVDLKKITPFALDSKLNTDGLFLPFKESIFLMQYTGLKDKNDKDIYEGDIIQKVIEKDEGNIRLSSGPVVYHYGGFCMEHEGYYYPLSRTAGNSEVIGNIYETPNKING